MSEKITEIKTLERAETAHVIAHIEYCSDPNAWHSEAVMPLQEVISREYGKRECEGIETSDLVPLIPFVFQGMKLKTFEANVPKPMATFMIGAGKLSFANVKGVKYKLTFSIGKGEAKSVAKVKAENQVRIVIDAMAPEVARGETATAMGKECITHILDQNGLKVLDVRRAIAPNGTMLNTYYADFKIKEQTHIPTSLLKLARGKVKTPSNFSMEFFFLDKAWLENWHLCPQSFCYQLKPCPCDHKKAAGQKRQNMEYLEGQKKAKLKAIADCSGGFGEDSD